MTSVAERDHFYAASENLFDAAPAPTQINTKPVFSKQTKVNL
jgi:hypothetical protein